METIRVFSGYINPKINPFIGCILGRCANRIRDSSIVIKGKTYELTKNDFGKHHLHGGVSLLYYQSIQELTNSY